MDRALLGYQRKNRAAPVTVAYLLTAHGSCDLEAARAAVLDRVRRFPDLTRRLTTAAANRPGRPSRPSRPNRDYQAGRAGQLVWAPGPGFDVSIHVREHALPTGAGDRELRAFVERRCQAAISLDAPPWEICLLSAPGSDRFHILFRASHVWLDGAALHRVLGMLFGDELPGEAQIRRGRDEQVTPGALVAAFGRIVGWVPSAGGLAALTRPWSGRSQLYWATTGAQRVRALARAYDATVNDVFLVALAGALDTWSSPVNARRPVRALMPVSVRREAERGELSNHVVGARISLPRDPVAPWRAFDTVRSQTSRYRGGANIAAGERWWFERIPASFGPAAVALGMDSRRVPVTTSNVGVLPGPMSVAGHPITAGLPVGVLLPGQRLFVMLGVFGPTASLSVTADGNVPDGGLLAGLWLAELDRLERAANLTTVPTQVPATVIPVTTPT